jgi:hypothetical protein
MTEKEIKYGARLSAAIDELVSLAEDTGLGLEGMSEAILNFAVARVRRVSREKLIEEQKKEDESFFKDKDINATP